MHLLQWVDNRTLVMCLCLLAAVFTTALLGIRHVYPRLRGVGTMAFGFFLGIPATLLLSVIGTAGFLVTAIDTFCVCFCYVFLYLGILRFLGRRGHMRILGTVAGVAMATVFYVLLVSHRISAAIVGISATMSLAQALIAKELFRYGSTAELYQAVRVLDGPLLRAQCAALCADDLPWSAEGLYAE